MANKKIRVRRLSGKLTVPVAARVQRQVRETAPKSPAFTGPVQAALIAWNQSTDAFVALATEVDGLHQTLRSKLAALREARHAFSVDSGQYANVVENACQGSEEIVHSLGMAVYASRTPPQPVEAPRNLVARDGAKALSIALTWDRVRGARAYDLQVTTDPTNDSSWRSVDGQTRRKHVFAGLTAGMRYWFRVATTGASQKSGFCAPVSLVAR